MGHHFSILWSNNAYDSYYITDIGSHPIKIVLGETENVPPKTRMFS